MSLEIATVGARHEAGLAALFARIAADPSAGHFHPHPFTAEEARRRARYQGSDISALMTWEDEGIGYGLLRGWDEGYAIPSLGIYIAEERRRTGAARLLMHYLHLSAKLRGAPAIRLKVYPDNERARLLYESFGYWFGERLEGGQLVGQLRL